MFCAIMQPTYFPWIGYFDLIDRVDRFVFLDNVKLGKSDWHVRNRIKAPSGEVYLTVNVLTPHGRLTTMINEAVLEFRRPWPTKHLKTIKFNYQKAKHFKSVYSFIEELLSKKYETLGNLNISVIKAIAKQLGIKTEFFIASEMRELKGVKDERLVNICQKLNCDQYLSPQGSADYLEAGEPGGRLVGNGIDLFYQNFEHPVYDQLYGKFISHLSILDLLLNYGFSESLAIIRSGRRDIYSCEFFRKEILRK